MPPDLLNRPIEVVNVGLPGFAQDLHSQHVPVVQVDWTPPARGNAELAWRSVEGSTVDNGGRVRFEPDGDGTQVHVELHYAPPGGAIGHAVAKAFGTDPASEMDHDLAQLRSRVEGGAEHRAPERGGDAGLGSAAA